MTSRVERVISSGGRNTSSVGSLLWILMRSGLSTSWRARLCVITTSPRHTNTITCASTDMTSQGEFLVQRRKEEIGSSVFIERYLRERRYPRELGLFR